MKQIATIDAVGHVICHDITRILKGVTKGVAFPKGHIVGNEDVAMLLSMGKDNLFVWEKQEGMLHENEAALEIFNLCRNKNIHSSAVREGKVEMIAGCDGLFRVDIRRLAQINALEEIVISSRHGDFPVRKGDKLAAGRVIPLVISEKKMRSAAHIGGEVPLLELLPYRIKRAGIVVTGNEVHLGRIRDSFSPVVIDKLREYGIEVCGLETVGDNRESVVNAIHAMMKKGAEMIICTGGMSVDPDDITPSAIKTCGAKLVSYGAPVLPGSMFLLAYLPDGTPVMGLPGCVMYDRRTVFDLLLPRIAARVRISTADLAALGHGGLCLQCEACHFPNCGFGKGAQTV